MTKITRDDRGHVHVHIGGCQGGKTATRDAPAWRQSRDEAAAAERSKDWKRAAYLYDKAIGEHPSKQIAVPEIQKMKERRDACLDKAEEAGTLNTDAIPVGATVKINAPGIRGHGETGKVLSKRDGHLQIQSGPNENTNYMIPEGKVRVISKDTSSGPFSGSRELKRSGKVSLIEGDGEDYGYFGVRVEGSGTRAFVRRDDAEAYFNRCVAKQAKTQDAAHRETVVGGSVQFFDRHDKKMRRGITPVGIDDDQDEATVYVGGPNGQAYGIKWDGSRWVTTNDAATVDPLASGASRAAVSKNVATEIAAGKPRAQAVAIALSKAGLSNKDIATFAATTDRAIKWPKVASLFQDMTARDWDGVKKYAADAATTDAIPVTFDATIDLRADAPISLTEDDAPIPLTGD